MPRRNSSLFARFNTGNMTSSRTMFISSAVLLLSSGLMQVFSAWTLLKAQSTGPYSQPADILSVSRREPELSQTPREYTWIDDDYPHTLPLDLPFVSMTLENSRHYTLSSPTSDADFQSIYPSSSLGFVRLGPNKRFFGLSMYHQIHCLDALRLAIQGKNPHGEHNLGSSGNQHWKEDHSDHCLNYLRQTILCNADLTLEEEFPAEGSNDVGEGLGAKHVCRDWSLVHEYVERNFEEWEEWRNGTRAEHHY